MPYFMFQWTYTDAAVQAMLNKPQDRPVECRGPGRCDPPSRARGRREPHVRGSPQKEDRSIFLTRRSRVRVNAR